MVYGNSYNKRGIEPKNIESPFELDELFFSITDPKGVILSSNDVFVRVSKMEEKELIGKPHNVIRHPDMPRAVFKALWQTIRSKKPFIGYVKNMAKDGTYYWVLAAVYPLLDDEGNIEKFVSIRLKPSSKYFKKIPELYKEILDYEHKEGMDKALEYMLQKLQELGFENYEVFAKTVFYEEIQIREESLTNEDLVGCQVDIRNVLEENLEFIEVLCGLESIFYRINRYFNEIFNKVTIFLNLNEELNKKSKFIFELAEDIRLLSLNASIESYKVKKEGLSFSTLSHEMRKNAELSERKIIQMSELIDDTKKDIEDTGFNILTAKLLIEMIVFFLKEMINNLARTKIAQERREQIIQNISDLFRLLDAYSQGLSHNIYETKSKLRTIFYNIKELNVLINRLDFIHINGLIESAHTESDGGGFNIIFSQMLKLIEAAKSEIVNLENSISDATEDNLSVNNITDIAREKIEKIKKRYGDVLVGSGA